MKMSLRHPALTNALQLVGILLLGAALGIVAVVTANAIYRQSLQSRITTAALSIDLPNLKQLQGVEEDEETRSYQTIKQQLLSLHRANLDARFVYIMGRNDDGEMFFYADSELPSSEDYSPPGQTFDEASNELKAVFDTEEGITEGPVGDRWGVWLSAIAPIIDPQTHKVIAVLGMDIPAQEYLSFMGALGMLPVAASGILGVIIIGAQNSRRKHEEMIDLKARLTSTISHDLRGPLMGIRLASERLAKRTADTQSAAISQEIANTVRHLEESVNEVFDLARLGTETSVLTVEPTDVTSLINEVFDTEKFSADAKNMKLIMATGWPPKLIVGCDRVRIKRVLINLVSNAIKYGKPGTDVTVSYQELPRGHAITVTDQGIGIPESEQKKVLSGYYRASNARQSAEIGSGLGMYLVANTVRQHGGALRIASKVGEGTSITIELPEV